jgi:hypothetical protein
VLGGDGQWLTGRSSFWPTRYMYLVGQKENLPVDKVHLPCWPISSKSPKISFRLGKYNTWIILRFHLETILNLHTLKILPNFGWKFQNLNLQSASKPKASVKAPFKLLVWQISGFCADYVGEKYLKKGIQNHLQRLFGWSNSRLVTLTLVLAKYC